MAHPTHVSPTINLAKKHLYLKCVMGLPRCVQLASAAVNVKTETTIKPISANPTSSCFNIGSRIRFTCCRKRIKAYIDASG